MNMTRSIANAFCAFTHRKVALIQLQNALLLPSGRSPKSAKNKTRHTTVYGKSIPKTRASSGAEGCQLPTRTFSKCYTLPPAPLLHRVFCILGAGGSLQKQISVGRYHQIERGWRGHAVAAQRVTQIKQQYLKAAAGAHEDIQCALRRVYDKRMLFAWV